jgi:hypothetical protein
MADAKTRVEIGFDGGLIVVTKLTADEWSTLEQALERRSEGVRLVGEDETEFYVDPAKISYVKRDSTSERVGF